KRARHPAPATPGFPRSRAAPGAVTKGRPCPFVPRSASMPRVPLRNTSTRPPDGERSPSRLEGGWYRLVGFAFLHKLTGDTNRPFQEGEWNRCVRERAAWMRREA